MGNAQLSAAQIAPYAANAGFVGADRGTIVAICLAESGGNTWAIDNDSNGSQDQGLAQINTVHASEFPGMVRDPGQGKIAAVGASSMFDPSANLAAAYRISSGGTNWTPWSTYNSGAYQQYLAQANSAADFGPFQNDPDNPTATTGNAAQPSLGYNLVDDHDVPIISSTPANTLGSVQVGAQITGLIIAGLGDVSPSVTDGSVELDADQIGELTFTLQDPKGLYAPSIVLGAQVTYAGLRLRISARETQQGGGAGLAWSITAQVAIAQQMKVTRNPPTMPQGVAASSGDDTLTDTPGSADDATATSIDSDDEDAYSDGVDVAPATDSTNEPVLPITPVAQNPLPGTTITPTDYIAYWVHKLGGSLYYGAPTYSQSVISPLPATQGLNPDIYGEALWDVVNRLASNYGYWVFDADGYNVWFGPPGGGSALQYEAGQGMISRGQPFKVGWDGSWGNTFFDAIEYPDCRDTTDDILTPATIVVKLPRERGELVRPGMCMWLLGVPQFDGDGEGQPYIVTKVTWALDSGQTPAQITAVTPINPVPTDVALLPPPAPTAAGIGNGTIAYNEQTSLSSDPKVLHSSEDFVTFALQQVGKPYVWDTAGPTSFDCSGLVEWAAAQVGVAYPSAGYSGPRSQQQYLDSAAAGDSLPSVAVGGGIRGAVLFIGPDGDDHVVISLGDSRHTLEAPKPGQNVHIVDNTNVAGLEARFNLAATIPGMDYNVAVTLIAPSTTTATGGSGPASYTPTGTGTYRVGD